jgi:uncharacterized RDD family membrane protein YckC
MTGAAPELSVDSVTGIEVSLPVAGPGARAYAFLIDWHIRLILALAWFCAASLIYNGNLSFRVPSSSDPRWFGGVLVPALAIFLLYHFVVELFMRGRSPGKRMAGVRIIARDAGVPSAGALLARNVFRLIDSLPLFYGVGLISVIASAEHIRIGDMAAGTLLVYEGAASYLGPAGGAHTRGDAEGAEIASELLGRWPSLGAEARTQLARTLLSRSGLDPAQVAGMDANELLQQLQQLAGRAPAPP